MENQSEIKALIQLLEDPDEEIFAHIQEQLLDYGPQVINHLEEAWSDSLNALAQERIENLVHQIQFRNVQEDLSLWYLGGGFNLLQGMLIINRYQYPDLDEQHIQNQLEDIKRAVWLNMHQDMSSLEKIKLFNHIFYGEFGFSGNIKNHHDPLNSYLNQVLDRRKGNQISLAVIYSSIAQQLDIPVYGINLPQHFILAYMENNKSDAEVLFYINAFNRGNIFGKYDVDQFLRQLKLEPSSHYYKPCSHVDILRRVLRNLVSAYEKAAAPEKVIELQKLQVILEDVQSPGYEY